MTKFKQLIENKNAVITFIIGLVAIYNLAQGLLDNNPLERLEKTEKQIKILIDVGIGEMDLHKGVYDKKDKEVYSTNKVKGKHGKWFYYHPEDKTLYEGGYDIAKDRFYYIDFNDERHDI